MSREHLTAAKKRRFNEFYTPQQTVDDFIPKMAEFLASKSIYCLADDRESAFTKHFTNHFGDYKLKKLVCTSLGPEHGLKLVYDGNQMHETQLSGKGEWQSDECMQLMREADVVVTNPPFSGMTRLYRAMIAAEVDFIIIAPFYSANEWFWRAGKRPYLYKLLSPEFIVHSEDNAKDVHTLASGTSELRASISNAWWVSNFKNANLLKKFAKPTKSLAEVIASGHATWADGFRQTLLGVSSMKHIPADVDAAIYVPSSALVCDFEDSDYEIIGMASNARESYMTQSGYIFTDRFITFNGKSPFWRVTLCKKGTDGKQKLIEQLEQKQKLDEAFAKVENGVLKLERKIRNED